MLLVPVAIESLRHEVCSIMFLQQSRFRHLDPRGLRHQVICVLDPSIVLTDTETFIRSDAIELDEPMLEPRLHIELACANLVCLWIPRNYSLRSSASCRSSDLNDLRECGPGVF